MLRIHLLALVGVTVREVPFDVSVYRQFADFGGADRAPRRVRILRFRHLVERHELAAKIFGTVSTLLAKRGLLIKEGAAVDATIIAAPTFTKSKHGTRDAEMGQTKRATSGTPT